MVEPLQDTTQKQGYEYEQVPKPQLVSSRDVELFLEGGGNLVRTLAFHGDIPPNTFRRPGAMALNMLQINIGIKGVGGT